MSQESSVLLAAGALAAALKPVVKAKKSNAWVEVSYDAEAQTLQVEEAKQGLYSSAVSASGSWTVVATVEGPRLAAFVSRFPPAAELQIFIRDGRLHVASNGSQAALKCRSLKASARTKAMRVDRGHKGKVEERPEGRYLTPKGDSWDFSAQVPFKESDWS